mmetsp:Transcript_3881/g.4735  ORF Transcript_3881/g.4735 Transcript_3881/m.4735 type:complete len:83 (+) Transcript_3881:21-269(+)
MLFDKDSVSSFTKELDFCDLPKTANMFELGNDRMDGSFDEFKFDYFDEEDGNEIERLIRSDLHNENSKFLQKEMGYFAKEIG